jgi:hypothetical protein
VRTGAVHPEVRSELEDLTSTWGVQPRLAELLRAPGA